MSLKTAGNILGVFELVIVVSSFAVWAALGFPEWKTVLAFVLLCILGFVAPRLIAYWRT